MFFLNCFTASAQPLSLPLKPQSEEYFFEEVKFPDGALVRGVVSLAKDNRGFIWLAGKHGLLRYDGHDFKRFRYVPGDRRSIIDTEVNTLRILADTVLCVGGIHGITLIDLPSEKIRNITHDNRGQALGYINCFFPDEAGKVWIAGLMGLYSFNDDLSAVIHHPLPPLPVARGNPAFTKRLYDIDSHVNDPNLLMLASEAGLLSFDKKRDSLHKAYPNPGLHYHRSYSPVYQLERDGRYLWAKHWMAGIPRFDMLTESWENFAYPDEKRNRNIRAISDFIIKNEREIWICDWDRGLSLFEKGGDSIKPIPGTENNIPLRNPKMSIFRQEDSTLWLANYNGLWVQNRSKNRFQTLDIPYFYTWVMPVLHDRETDDYYFGLVHKTFGVALWNSVSKTWNHLRTESNRQEEVNTYDIFKDSRGVIWFGTAGRGLWYLDKEKKRLRAFRLPDGSLLETSRKTVYKIFEDSRGNLWLGVGSGGVVRIDSTRSQATYFNHIEGDSNSLMDGTHFRTIAEDKRGRIWFGNLKGFCTFDPNSGHFSQSIAQQLYECGVKPADTYSIVCDTTGAVWMTIEGQGLVKITEREPGRFRFKNYGTDNGLKDLEVRYMTTDDQGRLWIVNNGLLYFNPYDESFMLVDERNGLLENLGGDARITIDGHGNVFAGDQVGIARLMQSQEQPNAKVPHLSIQTVAVNGEIFDMNDNDGKALSLSAMEGQNNLSFAYTAVCFEDYNQVRYRYKLERLENNWNPPTQILEARYTNLPPGRYRFVVDVAYKGVWLGYNREINFEIRQVFWKTWWFICLILLFVSAVATGIYLNRKRHLEKQKRIRLKIASDLHDDVGSTLSSISIMSDLLQAKAGNLNSEEMIREIGTNAQNMLESMDNIIWSVIPQNDKFENLMLRIRKYAIPLFESKGIGFSFTASESLNTLTVSMDKRRNIFLIVKEAVNNLVKYSECTHASIEFSCLHSLLQITVNDDGKGFDPTQDYGRNGLRNMKQRAEKIGGELSVRSDPEQGTSVRLMVKV